MNMLRRPRIVSCPLDDTTIVFRLELFQFTVEGKFGLTGESKGAL